MDGWADGGDGAPGSYFYLSYARASRTYSPDPWVARLYQDLCEAVRGLTDAPAGHLVGFMDHWSQQEPHWAQRLSRELATCRVFVPLYSPRYFESAVCGREWHLFTRRPVRPRRPGPAPTTAVVPALWVPTGGLPLPRVAAELHAGATDLGVRDASQGLYALMRLEAFQSQYEPAVRRLARRIVDAAEGTVVPTGAPVDVEAEPSAFDRPLPLPPPVLSAPPQPVPVGPPPPRVAPNGRVRISVLAPHLGSLPPGPSARCYGPRPTDWQPFPDESHRSLAEEAAAVARIMGFEPSIHLFEHGLGRAVDHGRELLPHLLLVDPWSLVDERNRTLLDHFRTVRPPWVTIVQPRLPDAPPYSPTGGPADLRAFRREIEWALTRSSLAERPAAEPYNAPTPQQGWERPMHQSGYPQRPGLHAMADPGPVGFTPGPPMSGGWARPRPGRDEDRDQSWDEGQGRPPVRPDAAMAIPHRYPAPASASDPASAAEESRVLVAQAPTAVEVDAEFSVVLRIVSAQPVTGHGTVAAPMSLQVGEQGTRVTLIAHPAAGLVPLDGLERTVLVVPGAAPTAPVRLAFRARTEGLQQVHLTAWVGGTFLCELTTELSVHASGRGTVPDPRTVSARVGPLRAEQGEVTLQITREGGRFGFQFISETYLGRIVHAESLIAAPDAAVEQVLGTLRQLAAGRAPYQAASARRWMKEAGVGLWSQMVPAVIKEEFWHLRDRISTFTIATDDGVPWELLHPIAPGRDDGFLIEAFPVLRRARGQGRSRRLRLDSPKFVVSARQPATAAEEFESIQRIIGPGSVIDRLPDLLDAVDAGELGVAHFACHNAFHPETGSSIDMAGGPLVPALLNSSAAQRSLDRSNPLVFLNACRSMGSAPDFTQMTGWAQQFLAAGAGAFIGTLWAVRSDRATSFATAFYSSLAEGEPFGRAVLTARRAAATGDDDPTWMAYSAYGDPSATAVRSTP